MSGIFSYFKVNRSWHLMLTFALALVVSGCGSDDPTAPVTLAPTADYYISAGTGNDTNAGSAAAPFKTITHALSVAVAGDTIQVLPGAYDATNGEVFPLQMPDSVTLRGDVTHAGANGDTTQIKGSGTANPSYTACLVGANGATVTGFLFSANSSTIFDFGVFCDGVDFTVASCTFQGMYGGVRLQGLGNPVVTASKFETASYGVYNFCNGFSTVSSNIFETPSIPVDINTSGDVDVLSNVFNANGNVGVQVQRGMPLIASNVFNGNYNPNYGAVLTQFNASPTLRTNVFTCATSPCVRVKSTSQTDLGTDAEPGGNVFSGASGIAVHHEEADTVFATGNVWHASPPVCGSHIVITGGGTVIWGADPADQCP